mmetsp:Transcript_26986/g.65503  ORF Transcript_26986/g.65503 Transcript_26986/m.65503 type:complete len:220 (+) Transcript_26986:233-892(+)
MNAASIAMAASLFNDKPMAPPTKSTRSPVLLDATAKTSSDNDLEDSSLLLQPSMTSTVRFSDDKEPEDYLNDDDDDSLEEEGDENVNSNGTGLIMYVTPTATATKAPYWKRRLGWKPNMARAQRQKLKNLFRAPIRRQATVGLSHAHEGDALLVTTTKPLDSNQLQSSVSDREALLPRESSCKDREWDPEEEYVVDNDDQAKDKGWNAFRAVNHELVFA